MSDDKTGEVEKFVTELGKFCSEDIVEISGQSTDTQFVGVTANFDGLLQKVAELGYKFSIYKSNKNVKGALRFGRKIGDLGINSCYPFKSAGSYYYHCAYGPNRQKKDRNHEDQGIGKRFRFRSSKKMDCKAILNVRKIVLFPDYKLAEGRKSWRMKEKILKDVKADARMEIWHVFKISLPSVHNHEFETSLSANGLPGSITREWSHVVHSCVIEEILISHLKSTEAAEIRQICEKIIDLTHDAEAKGMCGDSAVGTRAIENLLDVYNGLSEAYVNNNAENGSPLPPRPKPCEKKRKGAKYAKLSESD